MIDRQPILRFVKILFSQRTSAGKKYAMPSSGCSPGSAASSGSSTTSILCECSYDGVTAVTSSTVTARRSTLRRCIGVSSTHFRAVLLT